MIAVDVEPDRKGAVGIDDDPHRGLAALALQAPGRLDEAEVDQPLRDVDDRRRREAGHAREVAARRLFGQTDRLEHRSEEHTSELQSLMRSSYAVFCLKKKKPT